MKRLIIALGVVAVFAVSAGPVSAQETNLGTCVTVRTDVNPFGVRPEAGQCSGECPPVSVEHDPEHPGTTFYNVCLSGGGN